MTRTQQGYTPAGLQAEWTQTLAIGIRKRSRNHGTVTLSQSVTFIRDGNTTTSTVTAYLHRDYVLQAADVAACALDIVDRRTVQPERLFSMEYLSPAGSLESIAAWVPPDSREVAQLVCSYRNARTRIMLGPDGWRWVLAALVELDRELDNRKVSP